MTPLHCAADNDDAEVISIVSLPTHYIDHPPCYGEVVSLLIQAGGNPNATDEVKYTLYTYIILSDTCYPNMLLLVIMKL